ncbi:unnamed protein product [Linum tenue]|uniref:BZIP domain-containing protein n=1 Tax=Linum tenue TaxID=586396 RepID=A0AAV0LPG2_9ROSI|nr:unnamed protein product [Linum tenue]
MASSSGNSSSGGSSALLQNSGSDEDLQQLVMDERKRKRMQSNRESARRSRKRKQKHLDELMGQVTQLRKDNSQILIAINVTTQNYLNVQAENSILRAQIVELSNRLDSLTEILDFIGNNNAAAGCGPGGGNGFFEGDQTMDHFLQPEGFLINPLNSIYLNQPIMASPDLFQY